MSAMDKFVFPFSSSCFSDPRFIDNLRRHTAEIEAHNAIPDAPQQRGIYLTLLDEDTKGVIAVKFNAVPCDPQTPREAWEEFLKLRVPNPEHEIKEDSVDLENEDAIVGALFSEFLFEYLAHKEPTADNLILAEKLLMLGNFNHMAIFAKYSVKNDTAHVVQVADCPI